MYGRDLLYHVSQFLCTYMNIHMCYMYVRTYMRMCILIYVHVRMYVCVHLMYVRILYALWHDTRMCCGLPIIANVHMTADSIGC